jgi:hypothetical protein
MNTGKHVLTKSQKKVGVPQKEGRTKEGKGDEGLNLSNRHHLNILKEILLSLVLYFYKLPKASSKIVSKFCRSHVLLKPPEPNTKIMWCGCCMNC